MSRDTFAKALARVEVDPGLPRRPAAATAEGRRGAAAREEDLRHPGLEEGAAAGPLGQGQRAGAVAWTLRAPSSRVAATRVAGALRRWRRGYKPVQPGTRGDGSDVTAQSLLRCQCGGLHATHSVRQGAPHGRHRKEPAATRARTNPSPGISSCSPSTSSTASAAWAKACRSRSRRTAAASSGWRTRARRRTSPPSTSPIRASPRSWCRPTCRRAHMRSNSLETCGNMMAVAYQTQKKGLKPAGFELFDISVPEKPKSISFFDCSGPTSRGVHQLWFCDGEYVHIASGAPDFKPTHPLDDQFYRCIDVRNPSKPVEVGRWWLPGTRQGDNVMPPPRHAARQGLPRPQHQRLSAASGPLLSRLYRRRHVRPRHFRQGEPEEDLVAGPIRRPIPASRTPWCRCSTAT